MSGEMPSTSSSMLATPTRLRAVAADSVAGAAASGTTVGSALTLGAVVGCAAVIWAWTCSRASSTAKRPRRRLPTNAATTAPTDVAPSRRRNPRRDPGSADVVAGVVAVDVSMPARVRRALRRATSTAIPVSAATAALTQARPADAVGTRDAANPPSRPKAPNASAAVRAMPARLCARRQAAVATIAATSSETIVMPQTRIVFWLAPNWSMLHRAIAPGVVSTMKSPTATTNEGIRLDRPESNSPVASAAAPATTPATAAHSVDPRPDGGVAVMSSGCGWSASASGSPLLPVTTSVMSTSWPCRWHLRSPQMPVQSCTRNPKNVAAVSPFSTSSQTRP